MGCTIQVVASLLLSLAALVNAQDRGTCYGSPACVGTTTATGELIDVDIETYCCRYTDPGITRGVSYQRAGIETCFTCPLVFGFFDKSFVGNEQSSSYDLMFGYLSGPRQPFASVIFTVNPGGTAAYSSDFTLTGGNPAQIQFFGAAFSVLTVQHSVDGVAQEINETYSISIRHNTNIASLPGYSFEGINVTIVDTDTVQFQFSESDRSTSEGSGLPIRAEVSKSGGSIANPVTFLITPHSIAEARRNQSFIPDGARPGAVNVNPFSPYEAVEADFDTTRFLVVFPADEGVSNMQNVPVTVPIVDDDINERFEQLFLIRLEVVDAVNPDTIDITGGNVTIGIIFDNDALVLGFTQSQLPFDEPDSPLIYVIRLIKENNRSTEQTFEVQINLEASTGSIGPATPAVDYILNDFPVGVTEIDRRFRPEQNEIEFRLTLFPDDIAEGSEGFILESSPKEDTEPKYTNPSPGSTVQRQVTIEIVDDDPIIIGYEETFYTVNESKSTQICVNLTNPPVSQELSIDGIGLLPQVIAGGTADTTDYSDLSFTFFGFMSSPANNPSSRRICNTITGTVDGIVENTETVDLGLAFFGGPPATLLVLLRPNMTTLEILDLDVAVVGFVNAPYTVSEGDGTATLTIGVISGSLGVPITLNVQLQSGSATASGDYLSTLSSSTVILTGNAQVNVAFTIVDDSIFEFTEDLSGELSFAIGGGHPRVTIDPARALVNILDDDVLMFGFAQPSYDVSEAAGTATFFMNLNSGTIGSGIGISLAGQTNDLASGNIALAGSDYNAATFNTAEFSAASLSSSSSVPILQDGITELTESFSVDLTGVASASLSGASFTLSTADLSRIILNPNVTLINIIDDDQAVIGFSPDTYSVVENAGPVNFVFGVLSGQLGFSVDIEFTLENNTAIEDLDFLDAQTSIFSFIGSATTFADVVIVNDNRVEADEDFFGKLSFLDPVNPPANVILNPDTAIATITDDDVATVGFINAPYTVSESAGTATLTIGVISGALSVPITLNVLLQPGSATAPNDYLSSLSSSTIVLDENNLQASITFSIVDDSTYEFTESLSGVLSFAAGGGHPRVTINPVNAQVNIVDDDTLVFGFSQPSYDVSEGAGTATVSINLVTGFIGAGIGISLDGQTNDLTAGGIALAGSDYNATIFNTADISATSQSAVVFIPILQDGIAELAESFSVTLTGVNSARLSGAPFTLTAADLSRITFIPDATLVNILDDDQAIIGFSPDNYSVVENAGPVRFMFGVLSGQLGFSVDIEFFVENSTASEGSDFLDAQTSLFSFTGSDRNFADVGIVDDDIVEAEENFFGMLAFLNLANAPSNVIINPDAATATITDNDVATVGFINAPYTVSESAGTATLTIGVISGTLGVPITLNVQLRPGSATAPSDYLPTLSSSTIVLDGNNLQGSITFPIVDDLTYEFTESLSGVLSFAAGGGLPRVTIDPSNAQVNIVDDDTLVFGFSQLSYDVSEGAGTATVSMALVTGTIGTGIGISFAGQTNDLASGNIALAGRDYNATIFNTADISAASQSAVVFIPILQDDITELTESFSVTLTGVNSASLSGAPITLTAADLSRITFIPDATLVNILDNDQTVIGFSPDTYSVVENGGRVRFMFGVLSGQLGFSVDIELSLENNTAIKGSDFLDVQTSLFTFTGTGTNFADVNIVDDNIQEVQERFFGKLSFSDPVNFPANVILNPDTAIATITDNDDVVIGFDPVVYSPVAEGGAVQFVIRILFGTLTDEVEVEFFTSDGDAAAPGDYSSTMITLTFNSTMTSQIAEVQVLEDSQLENPEIFFGNLRFPTGSSSNARLEPLRANATIMDTDTAVIGFSGNYTVTEGGTVNLILNVISGTLAREVVLRVTTADGSAQGPGDYTGVNQLVTFSPGQMQALVPVGATADGIVEFPEYYTASASLESTDASVLIRPETTFVNVVDNDRVVIGFDPTVYSVLETAGTVTLNVSVRSGMLARPVVVSYFTIDGSATSTSPIDFTAVPSTPLTFDAGNLFQLVMISIENDDILENTEFFTASLSTLDGGVDLAPVNATVNIMEQLGDDAVTVGFVPQNYTVNEEDGSVSLQIMLLQGTLERDITVQFFTASGTATETAPLDYQGRAFNLTFTPTVSAVIATVNILDDTIVEDPEYFTGNLNGVAGVVMASPDRSYVTINDEADRITVGFDPTSYIVNETAGSVELTVRVISGSLERSAVVNYFTTDGSATSVAPQDFISQSRTLAFGPGIDVLRFTVPIVDDNAVEGPESFYANLTSAANEDSVTLEPNAARVTIQEIPGEDEVVIGFQETSFTVMEDVGQLMVCAELQSPQSSLERDVVVVIQTMDATARQPEDYLAISEPVTFSPTGPTVMCRNITIVNDDLSEDTQQFVADLDTQDPSVVLNPETADINIEDNDAVIVGFELAVDSVLENAGYIQINVEVKNTAMLQREVVVSYNTPLSTLNTATIGADYLSASGPLTFSPGNPTRSFNVTIMDDQAAEGLESFILALVTSEERVSLNPAAMEVEIVDDDVVSIGFLRPSFTGSESDEYVTLSVGIISGSLNRDFVIQLTSENQSSVTNAATESVDYQPFSISLTFSTNVTRIDINATILNDQITENREEFLARLQAVTIGNFAFVGPDSAQVFIEDDDSITVGFAQDMYTVNESDGTVTIMVQIISGSLERQATVNFRTSDGTATSTAPMDFIPVSGSSLVFDPSTSSLPVVVTIVNDNAVEDPEFFFGNLSTTDGFVVLAPDNTRINVLEVPGEDTIQVGFDPDSYSVTEPQGTATLTLRIIDGTLERQAIVIFSTSDGSATAPEDFMAVSNQQATFNPSTSSVMVNVGIVDDDILEAGEDFFGNLATSDQSVNLSPDTARVTISGTSQGGDSVTIGMDVGQVVVPEDSGTIMLCASVMMGTLQRSAVVMVVYQDRGAINGVDYTGNSVALTFSPGRNRQCFNVSITNDDNYEVTEEFFANLTTSDNDVQLDPKFTVVRITDEDRVTVGWEQPRYNASESDGTVELCAVALVNGVLGAQIQSNIPFVQITLQSGTANQGSDYHGSSDPDGFSFTSTSGNRLCTMVNITSDNVYEMDEENLFADLSLPTNPRVTLNPIRTEVVITDDDMIIIAFNPATTTVRENDTTVDLTVEVLQGSLQTNIQIQFDTRDGSAVSPSDKDYKPVSTILTFTPSISSITTPVDITDDAVDENTENFMAVISLLMGNPNRVTISQNTSLVTIQDNDVVKIGFESPNYQTVESDTTPVEVCATVMAPPTLGRQVVVSISTIDNTATAGSGDYIMVSVNVTFDPSNDRNCVEITTPEDNLVEPSEEFSVVLMSDDEVELDPAVAVVTVNESQRVTVRFGQPSYSFNEDDGTVTISIEKEGDTNLPIMVRVTGGPSTQDNVNNSLPAINQVITFAPSENIKNITIVLMDDNTAVEPVETYIASLELLNPGIAELTSPEMATISVTDDDGITIGFGSPNVTLLENDMTFMMCLVVQGDAAVSILVTLTTQDGTAIAGEDYNPNAVPSPIAIPAGVKRVCFNSSAIIDDSNQEPTESFMLRLLDTFPMDPNIVFNPVSTSVIILDTDLSGTRVNDTVIGDPLYTLPIRVPQEQLDALNLTKLSLCYEIHGDAGQWFNLVTDNCVSVNTRYTNLTRRLNVMDSVAVRAVDDANQCVNIRVNVDQCSATIGSTSLDVLNKYESNGIMVKRYSNRVRITVPNCQDLTLVMWVMCENRSLENPDQLGTILTSKMIKFVVMRGLNFGSREAHGLLGQFWNVPVSITPYNGLLYDNTAAVGRYVVNITAHGVTRTYTGIMHGTTWDHSEGPCLFVGNRQSGPIVEVDNPNDAVIQDLYTYYRVQQPFAEDDDFKFGMFDESRCNTIS